MVESQVPEIVNRAAMLTRVQQHVLEKAKLKVPRTFATNKSVLQNKVENKPGQNASGLWKERQLRDFRRANNLCYFCGDKFDNTHLEKCTKRPKPQLNVLALNDLDTQLSEDVLNQLEIEDVLSQEPCNISINAIAGTESADSMKVRALVQNKVMVILIDSGSSHSFVNANLVHTLGITPSKTCPMEVQVANGDKLVTDGVINSFEWWAQGHTFQWDMKVLSMGAYDAILGYDWLKAHSPMWWDWENKMHFFH